MKPTKSELRKINRALAERGERICYGCLRRLPLDTENFAYYRVRGVLYWKRCRECCRIEVATANRRRYRQDAAWREALSKRKKARYYADLERSRAANRERLYRRRARLLAERFKEMTRPA